MKEQSFQPNEHPTPDNQELNELSALQRRRDDELMQYYRKNHAKESNFVIGEQIVQQERARRQAEGLKEED